MRKPAEIRLATAADAPAIARMSRDWIEYGLGWHWTANYMVQAIAEPSTHVAVLVRHGRRQGFGIIQFSGETAHLVLLAIAPVMRHQGCGRQLMAWLEDAAQRAGSTHIRLECRADNNNAIAFYQRLGYRETGRVPRYYEGLIDAVQLDRHRPMSTPTGTVP